MGKDAKGCGGLPEFPDHAAGEAPVDIDEIMATVLAAQSRWASRYGAAYELLWAELSRTARGGKNFRGRLVTAVHDGFGGGRRLAAAHVGAAFELLHAGFLVHDDLIDHDTHRRGAPNLAASMHAAARREGAADRSAEHFAEASAILAGDLAVALAHRLVAAVDAPHEVRSELAELVWATVFVSVAGELDDVAASHGLWEVSADRALATAAAKTAYYSFQAPLRGGALLAEASDAACEGLDLVGLALGRAFQLTDDLLGVFAPEELTGKSQISDLREGKATTLMLHARTMPVWERIGPLIGRPDLNASAGAMIRFELAASKAPVRVEEQARSELAAAHRLILETPSLEPVAEALLRPWRMVEQRLDTATACLNSASIATQEHSPDPTGRRA